MGSVLAAIFICWALVNDPGAEDKKGGEGGPDLSIFIGILMVPLVLAAIAIVLALIPVALAIALVVLALIVVWWLVTRFFRFLHRKASERAQRDDVPTQVQTIERESRSSWASRIRERVRTAPSKVRRMVKREKSESIVSERVESTHKPSNVVQKKTSFRFSSFLFRGTREKRSADKEGTQAASDHYGESSRDKRRAFRLFATRQVSGEHARSGSRDTSADTRNVSPLQRLVRAWHAVQQTVHPTKEQRPPRERRSEVHAALNLAADLEGNTSVVRTMAHTGQVDVPTQLRRIGWFTRLRMHRLRPH